METNLLLPALILVAFFAVTLLLLQTKRGNAEGKETARLEEGTTGWVGAAAYEGREIVPQTDPPDKPDTTPRYGMSQSYLPPRAPSQTAMLAELELKLRDVNFNLLQNTALYNERIESLERQILREREENDSNTDRVRSLEESLAAERDQYNKQNENLKGELARLETERKARDDIVSRTQKENAERLKALQTSLDEARNRVNTLNGQLAEAQRKQIVTGGPPSDDTTTSAQKENADRATRLQKELEAERRRYTELSENLRDERLRAEVERKRLEEARVAASGVAARLNNVPQPLPRASVPDRQKSAANVPARSDQRNAAAQPTQQGTAARGQVPGSVTSPPPPPPPPPPTQQGRVPGSATAPPPPPPPTQRGTARGQGTETSSTPAGPTPAQRVSVATPPTTARPQKENADRFTGPSTSLEETGRRVLLLTDQLAEAQSKYSTERGELNGDRVRRLQTELDVEQRRYAELRDKQARAEAGRGRPDGARVPPATGGGVPGNTSSEPVQKTSTPASTVVATQKPPPPPPPPPPTPATTAAVTHQTPPPPPPPPPTPQPPSDTRVKDDQFDKRFVRYDEVSQTNNKSIDVTTLSVVMTPEITRAVQKTVGTAEIAGKHCVMRIPNSAIPSGTSKERKVKKSLMIGEGDKGKPKRYARMRIVMRPGDGTASMVFKDYTPVVTESINYDFATDTVTDGKGCDWKQFPVQAVYLGTEKLEKISEVELLLKHDSKVEKKQEKKKENPNKKKKGKTK